MMYQQGKQDPAARTATVQIQQSQANIGLKLDLTESLIAQTREAFGILQDKISPILLPVPEEPDQNIARPAAPCSEAGVVCDRINAGLADIQAWVVLLTSRVDL